MVVINPVASSDFEFEKVVIDEWINGKIFDVQERLNENRKFKNEAGDWDTRTVEEVRFVFELDGYKFKHYSRWMTKSLHEKSNLFKKYLSKLVADISPENPADLDLLKGAEVKIMWDENKGKDGTIYQNISSLKPITLLACIEPLIT